MKASQQLSKGHADFGRQLFLNQQAFMKARSAWERNENRKIADLMSALYGRGSTHSLTQSAEDREQQRQDLCKRAEEIRERLDASSKELKEWFERSEKGENMLYQRAEELLEARFTELKARMRGTTFTELG